jgi:hypothetical protein
MNVSQTSLLPFSFSICARYAIVPARGPPTSCSAIIVVFLLSAMFAAFAGSTSLYSHTAPIDHGS